MGDWKPSGNYRKIAEANRSYYAATAQQYESTETCVNDPAAQEMVERDLDEVIGRLAKPVAEVHALDACGGSGNISLKLLKRGIRVTLADISPELLSIYRDKCDKACFDPATENTEIAAFLASNPERFDLIVFSSALHHLEDIEGVLQLAYEALTPGGLLFTVFDPTARSHQGLMTRGLLRGDYYLFKMFGQPRDFPKAIKRRLRVALHQMLLAPNPPRCCSSPLGYSKNMYVSTSFSLPQPASLVPSQAVFAQGCYWALRN
jgi:2-polyprenyl-3-methyl-5-hydroxy-6-metoxy-1,4-benzoquinol methylase